MSIGDRYSNGKVTMFAKPKLSAAGDDDSVSKGTWSITIAAGLGWLFDAYVISIYGLTLPELAKSFHVSTAALGIVGTLFIVGYLIGTVAFGWIGDRIGRKPTLGISIVAYGLLTALTALANGVALMGLLRLLTGIGGGGELTVGAPFSAEAWSTKRRSTGIGIMYSAYALGFMLAIVATVTLVPTFGWRGPYVASLIAAIVILAIRLRLVESPAYRAMVSKLQTIGRRKVTLIGGFKMKEVRKSLLTGAIVFIGLTYGYYALAFYVTAYMVKTFHQTGILAAKYQAIFWAVEFVFAIAAGIISDRIGTKWPAIVTAAGALITLFFAFSAGNSFVSYMVLTTVGFGCIGAMWTCGISYVVQGFPTEVRGSGFGTAAGIGRLFSIFAPTISVAIATAAGGGLGSGLKWNATFIYVFVIIGFIIAKGSRNRDIQHLVTEEATIGEATIVGGGGA